VSKNLPSVTSVIPRDLRNFIDRLRELINGNGAGRLVTAQDLADAGVVSVDGSGNINAVTTVFGPPPAPTNVTATPAIRNVIVEWDIVTYPGHAYAEVWGADTDDLGAAELLGQTPGFTYTDSLGPSSTRYYWVRYVNTENVTGSYNSTNGTVATTGADLAYTMGLLRDTYGGTSEAPFFQLDSPTEINGVTIPAGTYMKAAFIYDAEITNAKIANLAVDTAKLASAAVTTAKIGDAQITTAKIVDANITTAKIADANITLAKIDTATITNLSALSANLGTVTAGELTITKPSSSTPTISGSGMTGAGTHLYSDGRFALGNPTTNIVFDGTNAYINGFNVAASGSVSSVNFLTSPTIKPILTFTLSKAGIVNFNCGGNITLASSSSQFENVMVDVCFLLNDSALNDIDVAFAGGAGKTAFIDIARYFVTHVAYSNTKSLAAGTYTLSVFMPNLSIADSSGTLVSPTLSTKGMSYVYANYHALFI
jgi:hypothetical protein